VWPFTTLGIYIPVDRGGERAYLAPFELTDSSTSAIAGREIEGRNIWLGTFGGLWHDERTTFGNATTLLSASSPVFEREGAQARNALVVEIKRAPGKPIGRLELPRIGQAMAPIRALHLRQYRDAVHPERAVCQRITQSRIRIEQIRESGELPKLTVHLHRYAMLSVAADLLGVNALEPIGGIWVRGNMRLDVGDERVRANT
jgi:hypothetical protein